MVNILVIHGTERENNESHKAAEYIYKMCDADEEIKASLVSASDFELPTDGRTFQDPKYSELTANADGFIFVVPEYNHSYPPSFKRLFDTEFANYEYKPVLLAGVSNGPWGGTRVVEVLLHPIKAVGLYPIKNDLYFPKIQEIFDESGEPVDEKVSERIQKQINELKKVSVAMRNLRA